MPKLKIDGQEIEVSAGTTIIQACDLVGREVPRFCYHQRLSIAGNCRMCLVEVEKNPKPVASCAMPVAEGMIVHTDSAMVKKAREGVMEFLLINHPLDCPICDQGGECDLQDQAYFYGKANSRFEENKRAIIDKNWGPLVKTQMTRCIHCTRCVRFATEVAGIEELGATGRGEHAEIGTYIEKALTSEISGNIIDLCPVGALTSKPYAFKARSWELKKVDSIDVLDAVGCNIRVDARGGEVMRILPKINEEINEEWLSDKARFSYDGLKCQRLDVPMIKKNNQLTPCSWSEAYAVVAQKLLHTNPANIAALAGNLADCEAMMVLKDLMHGINCYNLDCRIDGANIDANKRNSYIFNTTIAGIEKADLCLLIGANVRFEAPMINTRLRKRVLQGKFTMASIGPELDLTYQVQQLGDDIKILEQILTNQHDFATSLKNAKFPMIILGADVAKRGDGQAILALVSEICHKYHITRPDWNGYNFLQQAAARTGGLDLGFVPKKNAKSFKQIYATAHDLEVLYLLGVDEIDIAKFTNSFIIYQGHHGDKGASAADVILPGAAYTEKSATYVNTEGRVQRTNIAIPPPGQAKVDHVLLQELAKYLNISLPYHDEATLRANMIKYAPHFAALDKIVAANWQDGFGAAGSFEEDAIKVYSNHSNFYMSNVISKSSATMAQCVKVLAGELCSTSN
jgi:NADH-quinone oxidoreductase subunit G